MVTLPRNAACAPFLAALFVLLFRSALFAQYPVVQNPTEMTVINATTAVNPPSAIMVPIFRLVFIAPPKQKLPRARTHMSFSTHDIARGAPIKRGLFDSWCFRRSVANLQQPHLSH